MRFSTVGVVLSLATYLTALGCARQAASGSANVPVLTSTQPIALGEGLSLRQVGSGAYVVTHTFPWDANSLLVEMADRTLVLVATPYTPEATRLVLGWVRSHFGERRMVAINNGYHVDNLGGNAALREAGIPIYGSDLTVRLLQERGEKTRQHLLGMIGDTASPVYAAHAAIQYLPPDHVFSAKEGLVLSFGSEELQVIYPGASQAPDKLAIYFPSRGLLFGGCMILNGNRVGNIADADLEAWPWAIQTLAKLPAKVVIPAHGDRLDPGLIQNTLDVLSRTRPHDNK